MRAFYKFVERLLPSTPGTGNMAFQPRHGLPAYTIGGAGVSVSASLDVLQPEPPYYGQAQTWIGLEGLEFAQVESGQLYDHDNLQSMSRGAS